MSSSSSLAHPAFDPSRPPPAPGMGRGFALALLAHALLVIGLSAGVHWRSKTEPAFEAELWAAVPVAAAPREEAPPPEPEPEVRPQPPKPAPPPPPDLQAQRDAEIAIAKARDKKREELEAKRLADLEAERKKKKDKQREQERKDDEALKDQKAKEQKIKDDKAKLEARQEAKKAEARAEAQRQENLRRIQGMAGATGGPQATGTALQSAGPSPSYGGRIKARVRPNIIYSEAGATNPIAEVEVRAAPDGTIIGRKLLKPSGDAEWDKAVLRAIDKTEILPRDVDGRVPSLLVIRFQPRE